jgi:hypothetical protein
MDGIRRATTTAALRARWDARTVAGRYPALYLPSIRRRYREGQFQIPLRADTELVIDGFMRSGTTFAFTAFEQAQPRKVRVAHHAHAAAQIIGAVRQGTPVLLLIRRPQDSALSLVVRLPYLTLAQALRSYARYYEPLRPYRDQVVVGTFEEAVGNLGGLTRRVNERFGTDFVPFEHTPERLAAVRALIDEGDRREFGSGEEFERKVGRPSEARERMKDELRDAYRSPRLAALRERVERIHRAFTEG